MSRTLDIIVLGGSAGSLEPLMQILSSLPDALAVPVAVVIHVTPHQPSLMPVLLARTASRRVREPEDKEPLEPNTIYVGPPNYHMLIERHGAIALSVDEPVQFSRPSIDVLFCSAAYAYGSRVAGIVLSGSNSDGADGLRQIANAGGAAIVQAPETAQYSTMPGAALKRVPTAATLVPADIGAYLADLARPNQRSQV